MAIKNSRDIFKLVRCYIQNVLVNAKAMFCVLFMQKENFRELYKQRINCLVEKLPEYAMDSETEEMMSLEAVVYTYNSANLHLDEKSRNGKELKEKGYKLLGVLTTIVLAVFGLAGFLYLNNNLNYCLKNIAIIILFGYIFWIFCVIAYLTEHLLKSVDYWHSGQTPELFINKGLLKWCKQEKKKQEKHRLCYEINRIQDKIHFNEAENKRRLGVIDVTLDHLIWIVLTLIASVLFFLLLTL